MKVVLTIAGSDSGGGAGIQADLKTFEAHGVFGTTAITSITAQNTLGVRRVHNLPPDIVGAQIDAVFEDFAVAAVKIGMLSTARIIHTVTARIERYGGSIPIVLDPVMVASSGDRLLRADAVDSLIGGLIPLASLVTPNVAEAAILSGTQLDSIDSIPLSARSIFRKTGVPVLLKGGDLRGATNEWSDDIYYNGISMYRFRAARIGSVSCHGTGCTLSSAIAANLAHGLDPIDAIRHAKDYVSGAITHAPGIGHGSPPLRHVL